MVEKLKAPFPWFGGKSRAAAEIWTRFGDVANYVEPFAGSLAVLLRRPHRAKVETVNDADSYLANFWRALAGDPEGVAEIADSPVNETDLTARHQWLVDQAEFRERMLREPFFFDVRIAGWWVWGLSQWIGNGWCSPSTYGGRVGAALPELDRSKGVHKRSVMDHTPKNLWRKMPSYPLKGMHGDKVYRKLPALGDPGKGIHGNGTWDAGRQIPYLASIGCGIHQGASAGAVLELFRPLYERLRRVRVCCGNWDRVLGPSPTTRLGITAVLLDPPYDSEFCDNVYSIPANLGAEVQAWAVENGNNPMLRIALCGYEGAYQMPADWTCHEWKATGGYASIGNGETRGRENAALERIWFSPACILPQPGLFDSIDAPLPEDYTDDEIAALEEMTDLDDAMVN